MRVLITNNTLSDRAGTELYVRDLARVLQDRGHTPLAYSDRLGEVADELRAIGVPVVDDLSRLPVKPDIIHGHHHLETMIALLSFPGVPAVYFCHGWLAWQETPLIFPRILRYVAVDQPCLDRLIYEHGVPEDKTEIIFNFVDLKRFTPRAALPSKPQRAVVFSNTASEDNYLGTVREACRASGISLDVMGGASATSSSEPEKLLPQYDLVFAKARAALEAMAVGCAVVLCDATGCGPLVTTHNFDTLRPLNFGFRTLRNPITVENLAAQIQQYNATEAAKVQLLVRNQAGSDQSVDQIVKVYERVLAEFKQHPPTDVEAESKATAKYFQTLVPVLKRVENREPWARHAEALSQLDGMRKSMSRFMRKVRRRL